MVLFDKISDFRVKNEQNIVKSIKNGKIESMFLNLSIIWIYIFLLIVDILKLEVPLSELSTQFIIIWSILNQLY
jgi:hypothetical protein